MWRFPPLISSSFNDKFKFFFHENVLQWRKSNKPLHVFFFNFSHGQVQEKTRRLRRKEHLKISTITKFESDLLRTCEHIARQNRETVNVRHFVVFDRLRRITFKFGILLILRRSFQCCQWIVPHWFITKVDKTVKAYVDWSDFLPSVSNLPCTSKSLLHQPLSCNNPF